VKATFISQQSWDVTLQKTDTILYAASSSKAKKTQKKMDDR